MQAEAPGILAVWNNCTAGHEATYETWYREEHLPERVGVPGFRFGRRYEAVHGGPRFFTYYETDSPLVLTSPAYVARLEAPTPRTRTVMSGIFVDMVRTVCRRVASRGAMRGSQVVSVRFADPVAPEEISRMVETFAAGGALRAEGWIADEAPDRTINAEEKIRGVDAKIAAALLVETGFAVEAEALQRQLSREHGGRSEIGVYRLICSLTRAELVT